MRLVFKDNKAVGEGARGKTIRPLLRDVAVAADGSIWVVTDAGQLNRLTPKI